MIPDRPPGYEVLVVADAGGGVGLGHLARCSAVALALEVKGVGVRCRVCGPADALRFSGLRWEPIDAQGELAFEARRHAVALIDSYSIQEHVISAIAAATPLAVMHDAAAPPPNADLVLSLRRIEGGRSLVGPLYACLRPQFWGLPKRQVRPEVRQILVTTGGGDPAGNAAEIAAVVAAAAPSALVEVIRGPQAAFDAPAGVGMIEPEDSLVESLLGADLVVCAAGQTMLEACATGAPCITFPLVANQRANAVVLHDESAVRLVESAEPGEIAADVADLINEADTRAALAASAQLAVDGYGALRVAFALERLISRTLLD